jgi:hypothetical protein
MCAKIHFFLARLKDNFRKLVDSVDFPIHQIGVVSEGPIRVDEVMFGEIDEFSLLSEASISSAMSYAGS